VTPLDSVAVVAAYADAIPFFAAAGGCGPARAPCPPRRPWTASQQPRASACTRCVPEGSTHSLESGRSSEGHTLCMYRSRHARCPPGWNCFGKRAFHEERWGGGGGGGPGLRLSPPRPFAAHGLVAARGPRVHALPVRRGVRSARAPEPRARERTACGPCSRGCRCARRRALAAGRCAGAPKVSPPPSSGVHIVAANAVAPPGLPLVSVEDIVRAQLGQVRGRRGGGMEGPQSALGAGGGAAGGA